MSDLIDGVLRYSRACSGEETHTDEDLKAVVDEAIAVLAVPASLDVAVETPLPTIRCDKTRMGQVFQNLLGNAAKYMDKAPGRIRVGCREAEDHWAMYVTDNGPGIDKAYHEIIFKMFKTAPNHKDQESTGVGLAIVEKIVKGMGGRIWVESAPGEGSTFLFTLPKARSG
jgi:signal transduction histidine kinase